MPTVTSLDELRKLPASARAGDWELRLAVAESGLENMPWKLLYVLADYTGKDEFPRLADFGYHERRHVVGLVGYDMNYAMAQMEFLETIIHVDRSPRDQFKSTSVRRLYCAVLPTPAVGRYRLRVGPHKGFVERIFEVTRAPDLCWSPLLKPCEDEDSGQMRVQIAGQKEKQPDYVLADALRPMVPQMHHGEVWFADRDEKDGVNDRLFITSLPGRLPVLRGWEGWPGIGNVRVLMPPKLILQERRPELSIREGSTLCLGGLEMLRGLDERLLVRWWINGRPVTMELKKPQRQQRLEHRLHEAMKVTEDGCTAEFPWRLPAWLASRVKTGDEVGLQVLVSPGTMRDLQDPTRDMIYQSLGDSAFQIGLSNRLNITITDELLKRSAAEPTRPRRRPSRRGGGGRPH